MSSGTKFEISLPNITVCIACSITQLTFVKFLLLDMYCQEGIEVRCVMFRSTKICFSKR